MSAGVVVEQFTHVRTLSREEPAPKCG